MHPSAPEWETQNPDYRKAAGDEPLPGYVLIGPLGKGGFGEVWKCEAPGGLHKAVKFVFDDRIGDSTTGDESLRQEYDAFQRIKALRHPFLLMLERVELIGRELIMVMELADQNLLDLYTAYRTHGHPGIPRDALLSYMLEAAEVLDVIGGKYGLQHLDVKPANLFLVSEHVKVGDFGLVNRLDQGSGSKPARGLTPKYVAPEVLNGRVDPRSDQYSLALVYQELLTGTFPYPARSAQQMMFQHATAEPNLSGLPPEDRPAIAKALAKNPAHRFPSCTAFVEVLIDPAAAQAVSETWRDRAGSSLIVRRNRGSKSSVEVPQTNTPAGPPPAQVYDWRTGPAAPAPTPAAQFDPQTIHGGMTPPPPQPRSGPLSRLRPRTSPPSWAGDGPLVTPIPPKVGSGVIGTPPLVVPNRVPPQPGSDELSAVELVPVSPGGPRQSKFDSLPETLSAGAVRLARITPVLPVAALLGQESESRYTPSAAEFADAVLRAAVPGGGRPPTPGELTRTADGGWACRFPARALNGIVQLKLGAFCEHWQTDLDMANPQAPVLRRYQPQGIFSRLSGKQSGVEVVVHLPENERIVSEVTVVGRLFGHCDSSFGKSAEGALPRMVDEVRKALQNVADNRSSVRVPADFLMELYPLLRTGEIGSALPARCRDVSSGGVCFATRAPVPTSYVYAVFLGVGAAAGWAILTRVLRTRLEGGEQVLGGRYKTEV